MHRGRSAVKRRGAEDFAPANVLNVVANDKSVSPIGKRLFDGSTTLGSHQKPLHVRPRAPRCDRAVRHDKSDWERFVAGLRTRTGSATMKLIGGLFTALLLASSPARTGSVRDVDSPLVRQV